MVGRRPKPTAEKLLAGNPGKRRLNDREPTAPVRAPACPKWLMGEARREFRRVARLLVEMRVLTDADRGALTGMAVAWARAVEAEGMVAQSGTIIKTAKGNLIQNPYLSVANRAWEDYRRMAVELGLTPSSRSRVQVVTPAEPEMTPGEALFAQVAALAQADDDDLI